MVLDERKKRILQAVVDDYIQTAIPVGSRTLARKYQLGISPATIRNEMADLEEMGFLEQPHTSAGRIPSDKGYRFYVDQLMVPLELSMADVAHIYNIYRERTREMQALIQATARILSETTQCLALVIGPQVKGSVVSRVEMVALSKETVLLIVVTDMGLVHSFVVEAPGGTNKERIAEISGLLNRWLSGMRLEDIGPWAMTQIGDTLDSLGDELDRIIEIMMRSLESESEEKVYLGGTTNILMHPEFQDVGRVRTILGVLEEERMVHELLRGPSDEDQEVYVSIGEENPCSGVKDCSIVSATYRLKANIRGRIGVLGPKRMNYAKVVAVVRQVEQALSKLLSENAG